MDEELDQYLLDLMYSLADLDVYLSLLDKHGGGGGGSASSDSKKCKKAKEEPRIYFFIYF